MKSRPKEAYLKYSTMIEKKLSSSKASSKATPKSTPKTSKSSSSAILFQDPLPVKLDIDIDTIKKDEKVSSISEYLKDSNNRIDIQKDQEKDQEKDISNNDINHQDKDDRKNNIEIKDIKLDFRARAKSYGAKVRNELNSKSSKTNIKRDSVKSNTIDDKKQTMELSIDNEKSIEDTLNYYLNMNDDTYLDSVVSTVIYKNNRQSIDNYKLKHINIKDNYNYEVENKDLNSNINNTNKESFNSRNKDITRSKSVGIELKKENKLKTNLQINDDYTLESYNQNDRDESNKSNPSLSNNLRAKIKYIYKKTANESKNRIELNTKDNLSASRQSNKNISASRYFNKNQKHENFSNGDNISTIIETNQNTIENEINYDKLDEKYQINFIYFKYNEIPKYMKDTIINDMYNINYMFREEFYNLKNILDISRASYKLNKLKSLDKASLKFILYNEKKLNSYLYNLDVSFSTLVFRCNYLKIRIATNYKIINYYKKFKNFFSYFKNKQKQIDIVADQVNQIKNFKDEKFEYNQMRNFFNILNTKTKFRKYQYNLQYKLLQMKLMRKIKYNFYNNYNLKNNFNILFNLQMKNKVRSFYENSKRNFYKNELIRESIEKTHNSYLSRLNKSVMYFWKLKCYRKLRVKEILLNHLENSEKTVRKIELKDSITKKMIFTKLKEYYEFRTKSNKTKRTLTRLCSKKNEIKLNMKYMKALKKNLYGRKGIEKLIKLITKFYRKSFFTLYIFHLKQKSLEVNSFYYYSKNLITKYFLLMINKMKIINKEKLQIKRKYFESLKAFYELMRFENSQKIYNLNLKKYYYRILKDNYLLATTYQKYEKRINNYIESNLLYKKKKILTCFRIYELMSKKKRYNELRSKVFYSKKLKLKYYTLLFENQRRNNFFELSKSTDDGDIAGFETLNDIEMIKKSHRELLSSQKENYDVDEDDMSDYEERDHLMIADL